MAGIAGIFQRDQEPCDAGLLEAMHASLMHRGEDFKAVWRHKHVGLAANGRRIYPESTTEHQPRVDAEGAIAVVFDGRLDNRDDLFRIGGAIASTRKDAPDVDIVLAVFKEKKGAFAQYLLGDFACAVYDGRSGTLYLARDPIGVRPLYYLPHRGALLFGSEIRCLLVRGLPKPRPNYDNLAQFLFRRNLSPESDTSLFAGINSVKPGHVLEVTRGNIRYKKFWDFDPEQTILRPSYEAYVEEFRFRLETSLKRRLRSTSVVGVSLSGGLDSSALFCMARTLLADGRITGKGIVGAYMSYGIGNAADESAYIEAIEKRHEISVARIYADGLSYFLHGLEPVQQTEFPIAELGWETARKLREFCRSQGARVVLTGHWGDQVLFEQRYLIDLLHACRLKTLSRHLTEFGRWYKDANSAHFRRQFYRNVAKSLLPTAILRSVRSFLNQRYKIRGERLYTDAFVRRVENLDAPATGSRRRQSLHAAALYEQVRSRRYQIALEVSNKVANHSGFEFAYPYLDRELVAFLMATPGEFVTRDGVPKALLRDAASYCLPKSVRVRDWKAGVDNIEYTALHAQLTDVREHLSATTTIYDHGISTRTKARRALEAASAAANQAKEIDWSLEDFLAVSQWLDAFDFEMNCV